MNNSQMPTEESLPENRKVLLREHEAGLVKKIEVILGVVETEDWRTLKELIFDKEVEGLVKRLMSEAKAKEVNLPELYRLQGRLSEAKKNANLDELAKTLKVELENTRKMINA